MGGRVRIMMSGGAPLSPDTHEQIKTCLCVDLIQGYGLTETTSGATVMDRKYFGFKDKVLHHKKTISSLACRSRYTVWPCWCSFNCCRNSFSELGRGRL